MKIRNKTTGKVFEVLAGTLYAKNIFEEVTDDDIKVGEPTFEYEIEEPEPPKPAKKTTTKSAKKTKKGGKKNETSTK